jgi:hypothetical protein
MFTPIGSISLYLGSVVLDRPDQTGQYFAKDLAVGWAYLISDDDGDARFRGQGACAGGLDVALRYAFLSASGCVPECGPIRVMVESRQAHRTMVRLARSDTQVIAAIAGRPVAIMTRPEERASFHVRSAAERAASGALQERERQEWRAAAPQPDDVSDLQPVPATGWRARRGAVSARPIDLPAAAPTRHHMAAPRSRALSSWLNAFDSCVATVEADLRDVGAEAR